MFDPEKDKYFLNNIDSDKYKVYILGLNTFLSSFS